MSTCKKLCVKLIHCGNMNIANADDIVQKNIFFMPMGLMAIAGALRDNGHAVEIIHSDIAGGTRLIDSVDFSRVDIVGFDCHWVNQSLAVLDACAHVKSINPDILVVLGGYTASLFSGEIIEKHPQVDAVIRGDGEVPWIELCANAGKAMECGKKILTAGVFEGVQNIVWRSSNNVVFNDFTYIGSRETMEKLDFAAIDLLRDWECYRLLSRFWTRFEPIASSPVFFLEVGRGCQYACAFCGGNCEAQSRMNNRCSVSVRSAASVLGTIKKAGTFGFETFYSCFEFEGSTGWYIELANMVKQEGIAINYVYGSWGLPEKGLLDTFSTCFNQVILEISPETGDNFLRRKNKDTRLYYSNEQLAECLKYIREKGNIKVQLYFGYFLAFETLETMDETLDFIMKLSADYSDILELEYFNFSTDPGSLLFFHPEKYDVEMKVGNLGDYLKLIAENYLDKKDSSADIRAFKPRGITDEEVRKAEERVKLFNQLFLLYRNTMSHILKCYDARKTVFNVLDGFSEMPVHFNTLPKLLRNSILNSCEKAGIVDDILLRTLNYEYETRNERYKELKPTPQIWLYDAVEPNIADNRTALAMLEIASADGIDGRIDADFDL